MHQKWVTGTSTVSTIIEVVANIIIPQIMGSEAQHMKNILLTDQLWMYYCAAFLFGGASFFPCMLCRSPYSDAGPDGRL